MVNMAMATQEEKFEEIKGQNENEDEKVYVGEDCGKYVNCVVQKILLTPVDTEHTQRHNLFKQQCTINKKVCVMIVDSGSCENFVSKPWLKHWG